MANEGDAKDYDGFSEEARVKDLALDPSAFPNANDLQQEVNLGRLLTTTTMGDANNDGLYEEIYVYGGRSFAIMDGNTGKIIYDSGNDIAVRTAFSGFFNWNEDAGSFDDRSDDKGAEPEALAVGEIDGKTYAFVGLERQGGIMMYDISGIIKPKFVGYFNGRNFFGDGTKMTGGDISPESLVFIPENKTPPAYQETNEGPLLIGAYELSGSTAVYQIK
jgi:2',3'-cyclic-nucleotide 2'-phosphodiesterase/3'-nucleotidase/5'-nucleotidase